MAKRNSKQVIPPFPQEIDRDRFGDWLSGFSDGEGTFVLRQEFRQDIGCWVSHAIFEITLRMDDIAILHKIQSFLQCGKILNVFRVPKKMPNAKPRATLRVHRCRELATIIIPNFDKYPLHAKKKRDYAIWREGVLFLYKITSRKRVMRSNGCGTLPKWTKAEIDHFASFNNTLKVQRRYESTNIEKPDDSEPPPLPDLFTDL